MEIEERINSSEHYIVKSNLGTFLTSTFIEALILAKKIFLTRGGWAMITA